MKKLTLLTVLLLGFTMVYGQNLKSLEAMKYQAVVRDNAGGILKNQAVSFRFTISLNGVDDFIETQTTLTNDFGLVNLEIGRGTPTLGQFNQIDWSANPCILKVELDDKGGSAFKIMGVSEMLSVPYAQYAGNVNNSDTSASNELQALSFSNDTLYLSNGGKVYLGQYDNNSELAKLKTRLDKDSITLKDHAAKLEIRRQADSAIILKILTDSINLQSAINQHNQNDQDLDTTNELQTLVGGKVGVQQTITLSNGGGVVSFSLNDAD
ncbi:MAG: hypothetical protein KDC83_15260, partial [Flavobacteriales bacterium]|nr:hypothetical protein [Flavobacteriales bacterium]